MNMKELEKLVRLGFLPIKYEYIDIENIVVDPKVLNKKVYPEGVRRYRAKIAAGEELRPITIVKHHNMYAVVDGYHRVGAVKGLPTEEEIKKIHSFVIQDSLGLLFHLAKKGTFQPSKEFTQHIRIPLKIVGNHLNEILYNPEKLKEVKRRLEGFVTDLYRV